MSMRYVAEYTRDTIKVDSLAAFIVDYVNVSLPRQGTDFTDVDLVDFALFDHYKTGEIIFRFIFKNYLNGKYYLADENMNILLDEYDGIFPLFSCRFKSAEYDARAYLEERVKFIADQSSCRALAAFDSLCMLYSDSDSSLDIYKIEKDGSYGIADCMGKVLVPASYLDISVFPIERVSNPALQNHKNISLLLAYKDVDRVFCDVYDPNGRLLYKNVENFKTDYALTFFAETDTNVGGIAIPSRHQVFRITFKKKVKLENVATGETKTSNEEFELFYGDMVEKIPKEIPYPPRPRVNPIYRRAYRYISDTVEMSKLKELLCLMATTLSELNGKNVKEIMLSAPMWQEVKEIEKTFDHLTLETPIRRLDYSTKLRRVFLRNKIRTVNDFLSLNIENVALTGYFDESVIKQLKILKYRILRSFDCNQ